jgi:hypothetical protein
MHPLVTTNALDRMTIHVEPIMTQHPVLTQGTSVILVPPLKARPSLLQTQCQKKQRCRVANDTTKHQNTDVGMFWLHNPRIKITDVFPVNLPEKVCVNFCCRGRLGFILCGSQFDIFFLVWYVFYLQ